MRGAAILVATVGFLACTAERGADQAAGTGTAGSIGAGASQVSEMTATPGTGDHGTGREVLVTPESPTVPPPDSGGAAARSEALRIEHRPVLEIGVASGKPELEFAGIFGVSFFGDSLIAVGDAGSHELRIFDRRGELVRAMGRQGSGPGEFEWPKWFSTCGTDTLYTYHIKGSSLSRFSVDGRAVGRAVLRVGESGGPPYTLARGQAGTLVATSYPVAKQENMRQPGPYRAETSVLLIDSDGNEKATLGTFPAGEEYFLGRSIRPRPLGKLTVVAADSGRVYVGTGDSYALSVISSGGQQLDGLALDVPPRRITRSDREAWIGAQVAGVRDPARRENSLREYRDMAYPEIFPAYGALIVADNGDVWIGDFDPLERPSSRWRVFGCDGKMVADVTTPVGFRLYEVRGDELLGRERDADGVERVIVYRLRTTAPRQPT